MTAGAGGWCNCHRAVALLWQAMTMAMQSWKPCSCISNAVLAGVAAEISWQRFWICFCNVLVDSLLSQHLTEAAELEGWMPWWVTLKSGLVPEYGWVRNPGRDPMVWDFLMVDQIWQMVPSHCQVETVGRDPRVWDSLMVLGQVVHSKSFWDWEKGG